MTQQDLPLQTRRESYMKILSQVGPRQGEVLALLAQHPEGLTAWELAERSNRMIHTVRPRVTELKKRGAIISFKVKYHKPTDRHEAVWKLTNPAY